MVASEVYFALEGAKTLVAGIRLVACVLSCVRNQVRALAERFAAHSALMRLFARVNIGVLFHV